MRLSPEQVRHIVKTVQSNNPSGVAQTYLYGSRVEDHLKGGDIDLLILVDEADYQKFSQARFKILNEFKKAPVIGDQRIDLKIATEKDLKTDPFLKIISEKMIKLD